jgi:hypothetical protein
MTCAVVTAVELSLLRFALHRSPQQQSIAGESVFAYTQVLSAIGLTLTGFSIYWWRKGYASFSQPGQMLLLQYAATFVLQLVSMALMFAFIGAGGTPRSSGMMWLFSMAFGIGSLVFGVLLPVAFYAWCAWRIADSWPWRTLFVFCALTSILSSSMFVLVAQFTTRVSSSNIQTIIAVPYVLRGAILFPIGAFAAANDLTARRERSWTHWVGLILWLLGQIGSLLMGLYYFYFWHV